MYYKKKAAAIRATALLLIIVFLCPLSAFAAEPRASYYLDSYSASVYAAGSGLVQVWFTVDADTYMDEIGALSILLYESMDNVNFYRVRTYLHESTSDMLGSNERLYDSHVDYQGVAGRYYKAYVCIWAGRDGGGDSRYIWTSARQAK